MWRSLNHKSGNSSLLEERAGWEALGELLGAALQLRKLNLEHTGLSAKGLQGLAGKLAEACPKGPP